MGGSPRPPGVLGEGGVGSSCLQLFKQVPLSADSGCRCVWVWVCVGAVLAGRLQPFRDKGCRYVSRVGREGSPITQWEFKVSSPKRWEMNPRSLKFSVNDYNGKKKKDKKEKTSEPA